MAETSAKPARYDWVKHWDREIAAAEKATTDWRQKARNVNQVYLGERERGLGEHDTASLWNY